MHYPVSVIDRFWTKVDKHGPLPVNKKLGRCWLWTAAVTDEKRNMLYGRFSLKVNGIHKSLIASRFAYLISYGKINASQLVCHKCDNPRCARPSHLFSGTQADNIQDAVKKNRMQGPIGVRNGAARLTEIQVKEIKAAYIPRVVSYGKLAIKYGVARCAIQRIIEGTGWTHLFTT